MWEIVSTLLGNVVQALGANVSDRLSRWMFPDTKVVDSVTIELAHGANDYPVTLTDVRGVPHLTLSLEVHRVFKRVELRELVLEFERALRIRHPVYQQAEREWIDVVLTQEQHVEIKRLLEQPGNAAVTVNGLAVLRYGDRVVLKRFEIGARHTPRPGNS